MTSPLPELPLAFRDMREGDLPFVVSTWVRSLAVPACWRTRDEYLSNMRRSAQMTLRRSARVVVMVSSDHDSTIVGWACGDDGVVHHAYVRPEFHTKSAGRAWVDALLQAARGTPNA